MDNRANSKISIWFWQRMLSPHMTALADSLACSGYDVTFIANEKISQERSAQGWIAPRLNNVKIQFAETASEVERLIKSAPANSIHICQGFRGDGIVHGCVIVLVAHGAQVFLRGGDELVVRIDVGVGASAGLGEVWHVGLGVDGLDCVGGARGIDGGDVARN